MNLFQMGDFTLKSSAKSEWKIDCDALTSDDIETLAWMIRQLVGPFGSVEGIPQGGLRLAAALLQYQTESGTHLIVDDVLTTSNTIERYRLRHNERVGYAAGTRTVGAVIFTRGPCPWWIYPVFTMTSEMWVK